MWALVILFLALVVVFFWWPTKRENRETYFFSVVDDQGNESIIHDSGIKAGVKSISLQILKEEYNDGKSQTISTPEIIRIGLDPRNPEHKIKDFSVEDGGLFYVVKFEL